MSGERRGEPKLDRRAGRRYGQGSKRGIVTERGAFPEARETNESSTLGPPRFRSLRRVATTCAVFAGSFAVGRGVAPRKDVVDLASALADAAGGVVEPRDVRWEPSDGTVTDFVVGRWAIFLASDAPGGPRDVWRARVRLTPEGRPLEVVDAHDLTSTPLGDDHALVIDTENDRAAFATYAFGQEQSVTVLDLAGEGAQNKTTLAPDRAMAWVTNVQQTGRGGGVGRVDVTLDSPARGIGLALSPASLTIDYADDKNSRHRATLDLAKGEVDAEGLHVEPARHLPKRFVFWAVDTARAVSWIGPAPIAWLEDKVFGLRDDVRQLVFKLRGADDADTLAHDGNAEAPKPPPASLLDASQAMLDAGHWPPPSIASIWKSTEAGEGEWVAPKLPWTKKTATAEAAAPPAFLRTFVRPDPERPYSRILLVAMDTRQLDLDMEAGVEDPKPLTGSHGAGRLPRDPAISQRVVAAFNGAFKTEHGNYGMMVKKRVLLPPQPSAATVVVLDDGRAALGTWPATTNVGGLLGISDDAIVSFRQNLDPLIDHGDVNPTKRTLWGFTLPGSGAQTERSGLCVTPAGYLVYTWGDDANATALGKAMLMAGCTYGIHLDMNPHHTGFTFTSIDDIKARKYKAELLTSLMEISPDRYIEYAPKDFFYLMLRDPSPPPLAGAAAAKGTGGPWQVEPGAQPAPTWMPAVWSTRVGGVELIDVEAGRATWRLRAGTSEPDAKTGAAPLHDLSGDEAHRVLFSIGMGVSGEKHPQGLATDGKMVLAVGGQARGGGRSGVLVVLADGSLAIERSEEVGNIGAHVDLAELPFVLDHGVVSMGPTGAMEARAALGVRPDGRVLIARGTLESDAALGEALASAGCSRAVALSRGLHADVTYRRAGTASPPHASDDATTLFAIAAPLKPRAFRFDAAEVEAKAGK